MYLDSPGISLMRMKMLYSTVSNQNPTLLIQDLDISEIDEISGGIAPLIIAGGVAAAGILTGLAIAYFAS